MRSEYNFRKSYPANFKLQQPKEYEIWIISQKCTFNKLTGKNRFRLKNVRAQ